MSEYPDMINSLKSSFAMERELWERRAACVEEFFGPFAPIPEEELAEALKAREKYQEYRDDLINWKTDEEKLAFQEKWKAYEDEREEYHRNRSVINWHEQFKQEEQSNE